MNMNKEDENEKELALYDELIRLSDRIGDRVQTTPGCPYRTTGFSLRCQQTGRRSTKIVLDAPIPWGNDTDTFVLAHARTAEEFAETIAALHRLLDAHWDTLRGDMADTEGYWTDPEVGTPMKVVDPVTGKSLINSKLEYSS